MIRSNPPVTVSTSTLAVSRHLHDNRPILLNVSGGTTVTLPRALGTGARFMFEVLTGSNANVISGGTAAGAYNSTFFGGYIQGDSGDTVAASADYVEAAAGNNTYSPTTAGGGGAAGDWIEFIDIATDKYLVRGANTAVLDPTNRFSTV
jgi:hypothetical protein